MPSFETTADIFTCLSVFDSPEGSSSTFKTHKNISLYFKRNYLIIYNYYFWNIRSRSTVQNILESLQEGQYEYGHKSQNSVKFCCPKGLAKMNFSLRRGGGGGG